MKRLILLTCGFLTVFLLSSNADAHVMDLEGVAYAVEQQVKDLNAQDAWRLYSPKNKLGIEMYYDAKNIRSPYAGLKVTATKTRYNDPGFLDKLKKIRTPQHQQMGEDSRGLNYSDIAYTIQTVEMDCSRKEIREMEIVADFDKNHNLLNLLPAVRRQFAPIRENTLDEKLYNIICE